jgi:HSP20 family molecular chaperone IbpA
MSDLTRTPPPPTEEREERAVTVYPRVDVLETENEFLVLADMPGVTPSEVDVRFEKGELSVHGRRAGGRDYQPTTYHRRQDHRRAEGRRADHPPAQGRGGQAQADRGQGLIVGSGVVGP